MAAMVEGIPVVSAGVTMAAYVLPAAHVTLDTAALTSAPPAARMRVAAAGMLHNVLLTLLCAALSVVAHRLLAAGYVNTRGVVIRCVLRTPWPLHMHPPGVSLPCQTWGNISPWGP